VIRAPDATTGPEPPDGAVTDRRLAPAFEKVSTVACSALDHWRYAVRTVLLTARTDEAGTAMRGLAAWYERMCGGIDYGNPAPEQGLSALVALAEAGNGLIGDQLVLTYWALRVAQELAACRAEWSSAEHATIDVALAKLDVALLGAYEHARPVGLN